MHNYKAGISGMAGIAGDAGAVAPNAPQALVFSEPPKCPSSFFSNPDDFFLCFETRYAIASSAVATAIFFSMVALGFGICVGIPSLLKVAAS